MIVRLMGLGDVSSERGYGGSDGSGCDVGSVGGCDGCSNMVDSTLGCE